MNGHRPIGWLAAATALAAATGAAADRPAGNFSERLDVVEIEIPVDVRERDGKAVRGLTADDFRILERGRERAITSVQELDYGDSPTVAAAAVATARPRHVLLLFDLTFATPISTTRARLAAREVTLAALGENDLVGVATLTAEQGPRLLVTFTPDRAQVARAIDSLAFDAGRDVRALDPLRFLMPMTSPQASGESVISRTDQGEDVRQELASTGFEHFTVIGEAFERSSRRMDTSRVIDWSRGFEELARFLAAIDGRKQILFFSEGFDGRLLVGRSELGDSRVQEESRLLASGEFWRVDNDLQFGDSNLMHATNRLLEGLERSDCVVHAIDIGGVRAGGEGSPHGRSRGTESLFLLANESGGELFSETNDFAGQIRGALARSSVGYLLTFRADDVPLDGAWRRLVVELRDRRGRRVTYRPGWFAPRPFSELHPFERELLAANAIAAGGMESEIGVSILAAPFRTGFAWAYVPVILEIDGGSLVAGMSGPTRFDVYAYATTRAGEFRTFFHRELTVDPRRVDHGGEWAGIKYYGHFELEPNDYQIRVLVREARRGRMGLARRDVRVPDFETTSPTLLPPFFLDADSTARWTLLREVTSSGADGSIVYPFVAGGDPFIPQVVPQPHAAGPMAFYLFGYALGDAEVALEMYLLDGEREVPLRIAADRLPTVLAGHRQWRGELWPPELPAGHYRMIVVLREVADGHPVATAESDWFVEL